jgi:hypothetical protein
VLFSVGPHYLVLKTDLSSGLLNFCRNMYILHGSISYSSVLVQPRTNAKQGTKKKPKKKLCLSSVNFGIIVHHVSRPGVIYRVLLVSPAVKRSPWIPKSVPAGVPTGSLFFKEKIWILRVGKK